MQRYVNAVEKGPILPRSEDTLAGKGGEVDFSRRAVRVPEPDPVAIARLYFCRFNQFQTLSMYCTTIGSLNCPSSLYS